MHRRILSLSTAAIAAAALVPAAGQAQTAAPAPAAPAPAAAQLDVTGAYLFLDRETASKQTFVRVVFRTASPLPRRYDGAIRAGAGIEGVRFSIGSARRGAPIYTGASEVKNGTIASHTTGGNVVRKAVKLGRTYKVEVFTRDGQSVVKQLKLRAARPGDASGKPLAR